MTSRFTHVIGFDDAPFDRDYRGNVLVVGAVYAGPRLDGVLSAKVRRDGADATAVLIHMLRASRFLPQAHRESTSSLTAVFDLQRPRRR